MFVGLLLSLVAAMFFLAFVRRWSLNTPDERFRKQKPDHPLNWADHALLAVGAVVGWQALGLMMGDARIPLFGLLLGLTVVLAPAVIAVVLHNDRIERAEARRRPRETRRELRESQRPIYVRLLKR